MRLRTLPLSLSGVVMGVFIAISSVLAGGSGLFSDAASVQAVILLQPWSFCC